MAISDIPIFSMLRNKMQWHQERQRLLAENVANSDTPNFRPRDLAEPSANGFASAMSVSLARTDPQHLSSPDASGTFEHTQSGFQIRPAGNAVSLEDEMTKVANNQMDYQSASMLYGKGLSLIKLAVK